MFVLVSWVRQFPTLKNLLSVNSALLSASVVKPAEKRLHRRHYSWAKIAWPFYKPVLA